jgi:hypothetical protein
MRFFGSEFTNYPLVASDMAKNIPSRKQIFLVLMLKILGSEYSLTYLNVSHSGDVDDFCFKTFLTGQNQLEKLSAVIFSSSTT